MATVEIYTSPLCGFCHAAKRLSGGQGRKLCRVRRDAHARKRQEMLGRANGRHTVPQIFIGEHHVGGYDDLAALDRAGSSIRF
jgi:glutaredoxin 3